MAPLVPELLVRDFQASLAFYTSVLGFSVLYSRPEEHFAFLDLGGAQLMLDQRHPGGSRDWVAAETEYPYGRGINFEIAVSDISPLFKSCVAANAKIFLQPEEKWYRRGGTELGVRQFIVLDPDGYMLRLSQSIGERPFKENPA
ncbi:bleomycin resistance protein [Aestuariivirga sp.]|uniref:bleomycin resistance protein n=1 Tax=Aestuariivirga sp. TaxID=2650926 RepID=UPI0039E67F15